MSLDLGDYIVVALLLAAFLGIFVISRSSRTGKDGTHVTPEPNRKS